jgi:hypothetical protein
VKDTKLERTQHEATGRHQGSIQRSLRGLHREQEILARETAKAKAEVERLNSLVPSTSSAAPSNVPKPTYTKTAPQKESLEDRKRQWAQLAAMGIKVPDEVRGENAMAGDWKTVSTKVVGEDGKVQDSKGLSTGVRKRKVDEEEEEAREMGEMITRKKGWGNKLRSFPGKMGGDGDDVEALFAKVKKPAVKQEDEIKAEPVVKQEPDIREEDAPIGLLDIPAEGEALRKTDVNPLESASNLEGETTVKQEENTPAPTVVFKKRKKVTR